MLQREWQESEVAAPPAQLIGVSIGGRCSMLNGCARKQLQQFWHSALDWQATGQFCGQKVWRLWGFGMFFFRSMHAYEHLRFDCHCCAHDRAGAAVLPVLNG